MSELVGYPGNQPGRIRQTPREFLAPVALHQTTYPQFGGDMATFTHHERVQILNTIFALPETTAQPEPEIQIESSAPIDEADTPTAIARKLVQHRANFRTLVKEHYHPSTAERLRDRYLLADLVAFSTHNGADDETIRRERIRNRLATTDGAAVFLTDLDGTVTKSGDEEFLKRNIPGSVFGEPFLQERGRSAFPLAHAKHWRPRLQHAPQAFHEAGSRVTVREGAQDTFNYLHLGGIDVNVVSANFVPFVEGALSQIPMAGNVNIIAVTPDSILATDKGTVIKHFAQEHPQNALIFAGDGDSDMPAIGDESELVDGDFLASDVVACYFALKGGGFERQLAARGLPYLSYTNYSDIAVQLSELREPRVTSQPLIS